MSVVQIIYLKLAKKLKSSIIFGSARKGSYGSVSVNSKTAHAIACLWIQNLLDMLTADKCTKADKG